MLADLVITNGAASNLTGSGTQDHFVLTPGIFAGNATQSLTVQVMYPALTGASAGQTVTSSALAFQYQFSNVVTTFAGTADTSGSGDGAGTAASFNGPNGMVFDSVRKLFIADTYNNVIRKISSSGVVTIYAGSAGTP